MKSNHSKIIISLVAIILFIGLCQIANQYFQRTIYPRDYREYVEKYSNEFDLDKSSKYCIDNDDAKYYFDVYRSVALREADREKRKIAKWLESLAKNGDFEILVCVGRFSNGEAVYSRRTPRTTLLSAVV